MPPLASCSAAQSRVSRGKTGSGARSARERPALPDSRVPSFGARRSTTRLTDPSSFTRSIDDLDQVAIPHLADRSAGQRFRRDVADAGAGGDAAEARVGDHRHVLAEIQILAAPT